MIVLGFDPGPTWIGWAVLLLESPKVTRWVDGGRIPSEGAWATAGALAGKHAAALVAVEVPSGATANGARGTAGYVKQLAARAAALGDTSLVAGRLLGAFEAMGYAVAPLTAMTWRGRLTGQRQASDAHIARVLGLVVEGVPARSTAHSRDAAGCAWVAMQAARVEAMAARSRAPARAS